MLNACVDDIEEGNVSMLEFVCIISRTLLEVDERAEVGHRGRIDLVELASSLDADSVGAIKAPESVYTVSNRRNEDQFLFPTGAYADFELFSMDLGRAEKRVCLVML